jgi:hypothetical protein
MTLQCCATLDKFCISKRLLRNGLRLREIDCDRASRFINFEDEIEAATSLTHS